MGIDLDPFIEWSLRDQILAVGIALIVLVSWYLAFKYRDRI